MRKDSLLASALDAQRRRSRRGAEQRVALAVVVPDPDYAARLIDGAAAACEREAGDKAG